MDHALCNLPLCICEMSASSHASWQWHWSWGFWIHSVGWSSPIVSIFLHTLTSNAMYICLVGSAACYDESNFYCTDPNGIELLGTWTQCFLWEWKGLWFHGHNGTVNAAPGFFHFHRSVNGDITHGDGFVPIWVCRHQFPHQWQAIPASGSWLVECPQHLPLGWLRWGKATHGLGSHGRLLGTLLKKVYQWSISNLYSAFWRSQKQQK